MKVREIHNLFQKLEMEVRERRDTIAKQRLHRFVNFLSVNWRVSMDRTNESEKTFRKGDSGPKYLFRGPRMEWGVIVLKPGETMGCHGHNEVEETFYFIEGTPKMIVNDVPYEVKVGDAFRIEPLEKHDVYNDTDSPVKFVFIKYPYLPDDKITY